MIDHAAAGLQGYPSTRLGSGVREASTMLAACSLPSGALQSVAELGRWLREQPGYEPALDLSKALVFRKTTPEKYLPDWHHQPYMRRLSRLAPEHTSLLQKLLPGG